MICRFTNEFLRLVKRFFTSFKKEDLFAWRKYTKKTDLKVNLLLLNAILMS